MALETAMLIGQMSGVFGIAFQSFWAAYMLLLKNSLLVPMDSIMEFPFKVTQLIKQMLSYDGIDIWYHSTGDSSVVVSTLKKISLIFNEMELGVAITAKFQ